MQFIACKPVFDAKADVWDGFSVGQSGLKTAIHRKNDGVREASHCDDYRPWPERRQGAGTKQAAELSKSRFPKRTKATRAQEVGKLTERVVAGERTLSAKNSQWLLSRNALVSCRRICQCESIQGREPGMLFEPSA